MKLIYFFIFMMTAILISCSDKGEGIDPPTATKPKILFFKSTPSAIVYNGVSKDSVLTLEWSVENSTSQELNNQSVVRYGTVTTGMIRKDTTYSLVVRNQNEFATQKIDISVSIDPKVLLLAQSWQLIKNEVKNPTSGVWEDIGINPCLADNVYLFQINGRVWSFRTPLLCNPNEPPQTRGQWEFLDNGTKIQWGQVLEIMRLDATTLILEGDAPSNVGIVRIRHTYQKR